MLSKQGRRWLGGGGGGGGGSLVSSSFSNNFRVGVGARFGCGLGCSLSSVGRCLGGSGQRAVARGVANLSKKRG
jgi:hypothetical protein